MCFNVSIDIDRHEQQTRSTRMESVSPKTERVLRRLKGIKTEIKKEIREQVDKAMPHIRKAVTGDRNLRIRDFRKTAPVVRFADKASFFFGVNTVLLAEMVLLTNPDLFWIVFMVLCPTLILIRLPLYYIQKYRRFSLICDSFSMINSLTSQHRFFHNRFLLLRKCDVCFVHCITCVGTISNLHTHDTILDRQDDFERCEHVLTSCSVCQHNGSSIVCRLGLEKFCRVSQS